MAKRLPLIDDDGEVRELTEEDVARARPAAEVLPEIVGSEVAKQMLKRRGRPRKAAAKEAINIRLSPEVLAYFRSQCRRWQTRIDAVLKAWVAEQGKKPPDEADNTASASTIRPLLGYGAIAPNPTYTFRIDRD